MVRGFFRSVRSVSVGGGVPLNEYKKKALFIIFLFSLEAMDES